MCAIALSPNIIICWQPENEWSVDLESLEAAIDEDTAAIVVNSPSNPCGGVFSREHVQEIIDVCDTYKIPIIADDVYEFVVSYYLRT